MSTRPSQMTSHRRMPLGAAVCGVLACVAGCSSYAEEGPLPSGGSTAEAEPATDSPSGGSDDASDACPDGAACEDPTGANAPCDGDCGDAGSATACEDPGMPCAALPYDEMRELGLDRYVGTTSPPPSTVEGNVTQYEWPVSDQGPLCLAGTPYRMATRDMGSENLLIFLGGGGFCYSGLCAATREAPAGMGNAGLLDPDEPLNPVADWNAGFLPACDGSLFLGDIDTSSGPQRGLRHLSAGLEVLRAQFPNPRRILLAGVSAGGYGTIPATALTRIAYPKAEMFVLNDSGVGLGRPGDPDFLTQVLEEFDLAKYVDAACEAIDCERNEHVTWLVEYALGEDPGLRMGAISAYNDLVIGTGFLQRPLEFEGALVGEMTAMAARNPKRTAYFLYGGFDHTVLGSDRFNGQTAGGVALADWVERGLNDPDSWLSVRD